MCYYLENKLIYALLDRQARPAGASNQDISILLGGAICSKYQNHM